MSIEQLLFFLLLLAFPLLDRLIRVVRERMGTPAGDSRPTAPGTVAGPGTPVSIPRPGSTASTRRDADLPLQALPLPPALPSPHADLGHLRAPERAPRPRERTRAPATSRRTGQADPPMALRRIAGGDLRRAIALIAVLGPCRALQPKDASQPGQ
jgi:hypothetical protein